MEGSTVGQTRGMYRKGKEEESGESGKTERIRRV